MRQFKILIRSTVALALFGAALSGAVVAVAQTGGKTGAQNVATDVRTDAPTVAEPKAQISPQLAQRFRRSARCPHGQ